LRFIYEHIEVLASSIVDRQAFNLGRLRYSVQVSIIWRCLAITYFGAQYPGLVPLVVELNPDGRPLRLREVARLVLYATFNWARTWGQMPNAVALAPLRPVPGTIDEQLLAIGPQEILRRAGVRGIRRMADGRWAPLLDVVLPPFNPEASAALLLPPGAAPLAAPAQYR
jgi:hypothetical protein